MQRCFAPLVMLPRRPDADFQNLRRLFDGHVLIKGQMKNLPLPLRQFLESPAKMLGQLALFDHRVIRIHYGE